MNNDRSLLTVREAAKALGVQPDTLYAYVSRGLLKRRRRAGDRRSWFDPGEVDRLAARGRAEVRPEREVRIESAITALERGHWFYRGRDPVELTRSASFERVAEFLWTGELPDETAWTADAAAVEVGAKVQRVLGADALPADRLRLAAAALAGTDPLRHDLRREAVLATARRLLPTLVDCLPALRDAPSEAKRAGGREKSAPSRAFAHSVWSRLSTRPPTPREIRLVDSALILLADHELAASTFAVRIAAALRADPYGVIGAGLGVLGGALHGAVSVAAEALLEEIAVEKNVAKVIERHVRRDQKLPGIGHPIYPDGDPRARALLELLSDFGGDAKCRRNVDAMLAAAATRGFPPPNVDLGIAAVTHVLGFTRGSGELLFAFARMAGWIAHALEEYEQPSHIRPRAVYMGVRPTERG